MVLYVVIYSIAIFLILVLTIATSIYIVKKSKYKSATSVIDNNEMSTLGLYANSITKEAFIIINKENMHVSFASDGISHFFDYSKEEVTQDLNIINNRIDIDVQKRLKFLFYNWDYKTPISLRYSFKDTELLEQTISLIDNKYLVYHYKDITEEVKNENEMNNKMNDLVLQTQSKMNYLSNMSHEIRTPMNGIIGLIELTKENIKDEGTVIDYLGKIEQLSDYLLSLINDILDISKLDSGKFIFSKDIISLDTMASKLNNMFEKNITSRGIGFNINVVDQKDKYIIGDEMRLMQIMINFISNSSKFTPKGKNIYITIKQISFINGTAKYLFEVKDEGKGMSKEFLNRIFIPFEQENSTISKKYGGTGLGMAITHKLVTEMGGNIIVDSIEGEGSCFQVFLPFKFATEEEIRRSQEAVKPKNIKIDHNRKHKILIAEDNDINALIACKAIQSFGIEYSRAKDGLEAVELFTNSKLNEYDLILMDIQMPNMDGLEATKIIRALDRKDAKSVVIAALSANVMTEDKEKSIEAGMDYHYGKPANYKKIISELMID